MNLEERERKVLLEKYLAWGKITDYIREERDKAWEEREDWVRWEVWCLLEDQANEAYYEAKKNWLGEER